MELCSVRNVPMFLLTTAISFILYQFPELIGPTPGFKFTGPLPGLQTQISFRPADLSCHGFRQGVMKICSVNVLRFLLKRAISFILYQFLELIGPKPGFIFTGPLPGLQTQISFRSDNLSCHGFREGVMQVCSVINVPRFLLRTANLFILYQFPELIGPTPWFKFTGLLPGLWTQISFRPANLSCH